MKVKLNSTFQRDEAERALHAMGAFEAPYTDSELKLGATVLLLPDELVPDFVDALQVEIGAAQARGDGKYTVALHSVLRNVRKAATS